jgi:hypothetical protein
MALGIGRWSPTTETWVRGLVVDQTALTHSVTPD